MSLSVMILAGGQSRRMGQDKALLPGRDGQPLLCQTVQTAWQIAPRVVVVTPWPERYRVVLANMRSPSKPLIQSSTGQPLTVQLVQEPLVPDPQGPLGGFIRGWEVLSTPWCLLLACDLPYLEASVLQDWWRQLAAQSDSRSDSQSVASLVPAKGWEPLCGFYHRRGLSSLKHYWRGGGRSFQGWLAEVPVTPFYRVPKKMLFNCNTPKDWEQVEFEDDAGDCQSL